MKASNSAESTGLVVYFCINVPGMSCISETELELNFDAYAIDLLANPNHEGALVIETAGGPEIRIEDLLLAPVKNLCFESLPELLAERHVSVLYFQQSGSVQLDPQGNIVLISGDFIPSARVSKDVLIRTLYECGNRFIEYLKRLPRHDGAHLGNIRVMGQYSHTAAVKLKELGY